VATVADAYHKFTIFDFHFAPTMEFFSLKYTFWAGLAGGAFLTMASHGTEQFMVQRLLSARSQAQSRAALLSSWLVIAVQFTMFLLIGVLLFVYYGDHQLRAAEPDRIYPAFIWQNLPVGVAGLVMAAILAAAMGNLAAALNSLASTTVMDFVHIRRPGLSEADTMRMARMATVAWGGVLLAIAIGAIGVKSVLEAGLSIASISSGALLGIFLLGILTRRPRENAAVLGSIAGLGAVLAVRFFTPIAFTWYVLIGTCATFGVGFLVSLFQTESEE